MKISSVSLFQLKIPFKFEFSHSLSTREESDSLLCAIEDENNHIGYGEGAPRHYVTGETLESSKETALLLANELTGLVFDSRESLLSKLEEIGTTDIATQNPAAWCCIELAVLDLWAKKEKEPLWRLFTKQPICSHVTYSAVIPLTSDEELITICGLIRSLSINSLKIKLKDPDKGIQSLKLIKELMGPQINLRVDFNASLSLEECIDFSKNAYPLGISAIEQPIAKFDLEALRKASENSSIPIIADESLYTSKGPRYLIRERICHGLNIRVSSCGGLIKTLKLLKDARRAGMICQLGAHVGETALLTAAGRAVAAIMGPPDYMEGAAGAYLLHEDIGNEDISFGYFFWKRGNCSHTS